MEKSERKIKRRAFELREKGFTYALIEKQLGIPYAEAKQLGHAYDAHYGKPKRIVRRLVQAPRGSEPVRIPARDLRNDNAGILRQVEAGQSFVITVAGRDVAALGPLASRPTFVPRSVVEAIIREAPLDKQFVRDVNTVVGDRIDAL